MRSRLVLALLATTVGCDGGVGAPADAGGGDAGPRCVRPLWHPESNDLDRWPEPSLAVDDTTTETGLRLRFDETRFGALASRLRGYLPVFTEDLEELDGFGTNAEAFFRFDGPFDASRLPAEGAVEEGVQAVGLIILGPEAPRLVPTLIDTTDEGATLLISPLRPLPARARVAAFVTSSLAEAAGGCLEAGDAMTAEIASAGSEDAVAALVTLGAIRSREQLVALSVFETQSIEEDSLAVAADILAGPALAFTAPPVCVDEAFFTRCETSYTATDYREGDGVFRRARGEAPRRGTSYEVPVSVWLPTTGEAPYPTLFFGHGLSGDRNQARRLAELAAPQGWATIATPALLHGEHPTNPDPDGEALNVVLNFFAIGDLSERAVHATRLRDHFRQTTWDRLQLTRVLETAPDIDGDGTADLDRERLAYLGVSLGGLMGPELLSLTDAYGAGVLVVPGGRVSNIIREGALFMSLIELLRPRGTTEGDIRRFFPILQTILDAGDPASYAPHVLAERFDASPGPVDILVGVVLDDDIVPNVANYALGRALGIPIVEPLRRAEVGFAVVPGPLQGNFMDGAATGGLLQFDVVEEAGEILPATHNNIGDSDVGATAWLDFLESHLAGSAVVRDPYAAVGFPRP